MLSFDEYLAFNDQHRLNEELILIRMQNDYVSGLKHEIIDAFDQCLVFGGYLAVALVKPFSGNLQIYGKRSRPGPAKVALT